MRRALEAIGLKVNRLIRVSYGPFHLGNLKPSAVEEISHKIMNEQLGQTLRRPSKDKKRPSAPARDAKAGGSRAHRRRKP